MDAPSERWTYPWARSSKVETLPITRTPYGYVQRALYQQPDLHHETVLEVDSPFATVVAQGTQVFTFLVLGDQNAGKTTFLHAFTNSSDPNFLRLTSYLPMLSSTFVNTRFLQPESTMPPRDELPFVDTDLGQSSFLMGVDDFNFFLHEFDLTIEPVPEDTVFIVVQFIELGGDHLDAMMGFADNTPSGVDRETRDVLKRSLALLQGARRTVFFLNASTLFPPVPTDPGRVCLDAVQLQRLVARVAWLGYTLPDGHGCLFYVSRLPPPSAFPDRSRTESWTTAQRIMKVHFQATDNDDDDDDDDDDEGPVMAELLGTEGGSRHPLVTFIRQLMRAIHSAGCWAVHTVGVFPAEHLTHNPWLPHPGSTTEEGELVLHPPAIMATLIRLFRGKMLHACRDPDMLVARHLVVCFRDTQARLHDTELAEGGTLFDYWMDAEDFRRYLNGLEVCELPETTLLQRFGHTVHAMTDAGMCLVHYAGEHMAMRVDLHAGPSQRKVLWNPAQEVHGSVLRVRFPYFPPLLDVLESYFTRDIPCELWLGHGAGSLHEDEALQDRLRGVMEELTQTVLRAWQPRSDRPWLHQFLWMLEEWLLAFDLLADRRSSTIQFPLSLTIPSSMWMYSYDDGGDDDDDDDDGSTTRVLVLPVVVMGQ